MLRSLPALVILLLIAAPVLPAASLTIDNFEEGPFVVNDAVSSSGEQSGLSSANVVGGVRMVRLSTSPSGFSANGLATLFPAPVVDDGMSLTMFGLVPNPAYPGCLATDPTCSPLVPGPTPAGATTSVQLIYDGIANLAIDGFGGALGLDLSAFSSIDITASAPTIVPLTPTTFSLQLWTSSGQMTSGPVPFVNGVTSFPLSNFPAVDVSDILAIRVILLGVDVGETPFVSDISAIPIPEPAAGLLVAVGLIGIAMIRRRA